MPKQRCPRCGKTVRLVTKTYWAEEDPKMIVADGQEFEHWVPHLPVCKGSPKPVAPVASEKPEVTANIMGRTLKKGESVRVKLGGKGDAEAG